MGWFEDFRVDINSQTGQSLSTDQLLRQIQIFKAREIRETPVLRYHYIDDPSDWSRIGRGTSVNKPKPDFPGADLLLSFHGYVYPSVQSEVIDRLREFLEEKARKKHTMIGRALIKEEERRNKGRKGKRFWDYNKERIQKKYKGYYVLFRVTSGEKLTVELLAIDSNYKIPTLTNVFWGCNGELWSGDLISSPNKFTGMVVRNSSDKIIEPVSFCLLRNRRRRTTKISEPNLYLTGAVVGWVDASEGNIICSRFALIKLPNQPDQSSIHRDFPSILASEKWSNFKRKVTCLNWPNRRRMFEILNEDSNRIEKNYILEKFNFSMEWPKF